MPPASSQRNRARAVLRRGDFRCGEAVLQADGVVDADDGGGQAIQREAAEPERHDGESATADVDDGARHEAARRPTFAIHSDIGIVDNAEPST